jgi:hypothetical protein
LFTPFAAFEQSVQAVLTPCQCKALQLSSEAKEMTSILSRKQIAAIRGHKEPQTETEGLNMCQNCFLSELPGVVFGIVTVIWIVSTIGLLNR